MATAKDIVNAAVRGDVDTYNDGYTHEALHATHMLMESFNDYVLETPCADHYEDIKERAGQIHELMYQLYQLIGSKEQ